MYDAGLVTPEEVEELQRTAEAANQVAGSAPSGVEPSMPLRVTLFPFTARKMHELYPAQYPK